MPTLTITVTDHDLAQLTELGGELGLSARRMGERLLHRTLTRTVGPRPVTHQQRSSDRALRQLELLRILRRRRIETLGQNEKKALAKRFGVAERTIYRDLVVLDRARAHDAATRAAQGHPRDDTDDELPEDSAAPQAVEA